jgi:hypothetical protein
MLGLLRLAFGWSLLSLLLLRRRLLLLFLVAALRECTC